MEIQEFRSVNQRIVPGKIMEDTMNHFPLPASHFPQANHKSGISLIAVLMFMLAATTASIVVFRYLGQENFSSGARLKNSEAFQASQSGLEAVQGWLTNKGADAGALIRVFEEAKTPVLMESNAASRIDLLGGMQSNRQQQYKVYLTGVNTNERPYKLRFLSIGTARDSSKYSQVAIFDVEGLYKMKLDGTPNTTPGRAQKVPPLFGGTSGTQGFAESAYIIGDTKLTSGYKTIGDVLITGSITDMASGAVIGCPYKPGSNTELVDNYPGESVYKSNIAINPEYYGNFYLKENFTGNATRVCGNAYIGGNLNSSDKVQVWGDLYVEGNVNITNQLIVYGNLTVKGNLNIEMLDVKGNLVMPNSNSVITLGNDNQSAATNPGTTVWWAGTSCPNNLNNRCQKITSKNTYSANGQPPKGAGTLSYLGDQITKTKVNGNYIIPDPIVTGMVADSWLDLAIPNGCDAKLRNPSAQNSWASGTGTYNGKTYSNVINMPNFDNQSDRDYGTKELIEKLNSCAAIGNLNGQDGSKWLVVKVNWNDAHAGIINYTLQGNFIFIVMDKPNSEYYPFTTQTSNVLLYLTKGASNIEMNQPSAGKYRNYFIYSEKDIDKIDGRLYLKGNIFMANGAKLPNMTDPTIVENESLFNALSNAGVITDNPNKCKGTGNDDGTGKCKDTDENNEDGTVTPPTPDIPVPNGVFDPALSYIPALPHLKVAMQSVYANEESLANSTTNARAAILVMPRVIYLTPTQIQAPAFNIADYFNVLYLNGATKPADANTIKSNVQNCGLTPEEGKKTICNLNLRAAAGAGCNNSDLCNNAFYVVIAATPPNSSNSGGGASSPSGLSSGVQQSSSSSVSSSNSNFNCAAYQANWCNNTTPIVNTTNRPTVGQCVFVSDFTQLTPKSSGGAFRINSATANCNTPSQNCGSTANKAKYTKQDGGYYIYFESGEFSGTNAWAVTQGTPVCTASSSSAASSSSTSTPTITCVINPTSYKIGENVTATINCTGGGNKDMNSAAFTPTGQSVKDWQQWKNGSQSYYETAGTSTYTVSGVKCNNVTAANVTCPTLTITGPTVTCDLRGGTHNIGASINSPTLSCGDGFNVSSRNFSGSVPTNDNQWNSNGSGAYNASGAKNDITVSGNCASHNNNVNVAYNVSCTNPFTINAIMCSISGSNNGKTSFNINENINSPQLSNCDNPNNRNYSITGGGNSDVNGGWNNNGQVKFSSGGQKSATLSSVQCGNVNVSNLNASCGNITIAAASSSSAAASSSSGSTPTSSCYVHPLTPYGTVPSDPKNQCIQKDGVCYGCVNNHDNCSYDWFWGGNWNNNWPNEGWLRVVSCTDGGGGTPSSSSAASSSSAGGGGTCGAGSSFGDNNSPRAGDCLNVTNNCTSSNGLPLKLFNDNGGTSWTGTLLCSNGSSKTITCSAAPCDSNACPSGTTGAWLSITSITGSPKVRSNCW